MRLQGISGTRPLEDGASRAASSDCLQAVMPRPPWPIRLRRPAEREWPACETGAFTAPTKTLKRTRCKQCEGLCPAACTRHWRSQAN